MKRSSYLIAAGLFFCTASCLMDRAPEGLRRTPEGPGATVRFDFGHKPLPDIPLPNDTATFPDPQSRTGLRINASLVAPTAIETKARKRFSELEGWGTFSPITVAFDIDYSAPGYANFKGAALDLREVKRRHVGDDYDFKDDAIYVINLGTGVPAVLDLGAGNFDYTLKSLDRYWPNDPRRTERNLMFETVDESKSGTPVDFLPESDTDFDGVMDIPNLLEPYGCPDADPICDHPEEPGYSEPACALKRQERDRCIADGLLTFYERETNTLIARPLLPLQEMTRYAVVLTDRLKDGLGNAVKSPFEYIHHASMESTAARVRDVLNDPKLSSYYGDIHGTGLEHVAFTWSFTTQPTVKDMQLLRDGLYGRGPFARWEKEFPAHFEVLRSVGLVGGLAQGASEEPGWETSQKAQAANCPVNPATGKVGNLFLLRYEDLKPQIRTLVVDGFGLGEGPATDLLLRKFDAIDYMLIGTFQSPFLLEGGPGSADPNAAFNVNFENGTGEVHTDTVPFWLVVPKAGAARKQPFDVNIYGHGYTGNFSEPLLYAGNMAEHGIATIGINAMGHGIYFDSSSEFLARALLGSACVAPFYDAITTSRARDLNADGVPDSGGDFWSSYLFHTRDGVRQSVLDHIQLVRILRSFGQSGEAMHCRSEASGWDKSAKPGCDINSDGTPEIVGDFDSDGTADVGGPNALYGTWGESLGGILSAIHGAVDPYIDTAAPGSGGGGLIDIGIRSFQGGVIEAVLLRLLGPLLVTVEAKERPPCAESDSRECTVCSPEQISLRWVVPNLNDTGEVEIQCLKAGAVANTTVFVSNLDNGELRCTGIGGDERMRIGIPSSIGDRIYVAFYDGKDAVKDYKSCETTLPAGTLPKVEVAEYGPGRYAQGSQNALESAECESATCHEFQGYFLGEGTALIAPAEGFGLRRQSPELRRFMSLAQAALDPGDPINFAPHYAIQPLTRPDGSPIGPRSVFTINTIGDMNVPVNTGIAFARATGALPFFTPSQADAFPEYADYATPQALYEALGNRTPNQDLIQNHVIEGITALARNPAGPGCSSNANAKPSDGTYLTQTGESKSCYPACPDTECFSGTSCDENQGVCVPRTLSARTCEEALFDSDNVDEGKDLYLERSAAVAHRLARYSQSAKESGVSSVWAPRLLGVPANLPNGGHDLDYKPDPAKPLVALLNAYVVPQGTHTFVNGEPCQNFDHGTYLTNLTARYFMTAGSDLYYLSHPESHHCLAQETNACGYMSNSP